MAVDDSAVRDLRLDLEHTQSSTEIRLPSAIGWVDGVGLGFFGLVVLLFWAFLGWAAWRAPQRSIIPIVSSSAIAIGVIFLLFRLTRWHRYGVVVRITSDRLAIRRPWSTGLTATEIYLSQVRFEPDRQGIVVAGGRRRMRFGTGLSEEARRSVVEFLLRVIEGHLEPYVGSMGGPTASAYPEGRSFAATTSGVDISSLDVDMLFLALCLRCQQADSDRERKVHVAPDIPPALLRAALESYLEIRDDEILLAIVGVGDWSLPGTGCALTTLRVYWPGGMSSTFEGLPRRCRWLDYSALPAAIGLSGPVAPAVALGDGNRIRVAGGQQVRDALVAFLKAARSLAVGAPPDPAVWEAASLAPRCDVAYSLRGGLGGPADRVTERNAAQWAWPRAVAASREARARQGEIRMFQGRFPATQGLVTWAIMAACIVVYALLVAAANQRVPRSFSPDNTVMLEWGAEFGPPVLYQGELWRLVTCMFLHFGPLHLLVNMFCLVTAGPFVERLFGHLGFAGLYLISGLAGSLAGLCVHPAVIAAGALGAIFGVIGALLAFLTLRRSAVPAAKLKPMSVAVLAFVGYNTIFALWSSGIDVAAHLGGLTGGFVCGLLLIGASPARSSVPGRFGAALKRLAVLAACSAVLAASWPRVSEFARARILTDPVYGATIAAKNEALDDWNEFNAAAKPVIEKMKSTSEQLQKLLADPGPGQIAPKALAALLDGVYKLRYGIDSLPASNEEIRGMKRGLAKAYRHQLWIADFANSASGGELYRANAAYDEAIQSFEELVDAYFRAHLLQPGMRKP